MKYSEKKNFTQRQILKWICGPDCYFEAYRNVTLGLSLKIDFYNEN